MTNVLIDAFLHKECTKNLCTKLLSEIRELRSRGVAEVKEYGFNRFYVTIYFKENKAYLEDDIRMHDEEDITIDLDEFLVLLEKRLKEFS